MSNFPGHGTYFLLLNGCGHPNHPPGHHATLLFLSNMSTPISLTSHLRTATLRQYHMAALSMAAFQLDRSTAQRQVHPSTFHRDRSRRLRSTCDQILSYLQTITRTMLLFFHTQVDASPIKPQLKEVHGPSTSINSNLALKHHNLLAMVLHSLDCCPRP
jgi:hypothetical protein